MTGTCNVSLPYSSSTEFVRVLVLACEIVESELPSFIRELAEGRNGLSLVFMHHSDSLKSRTSYQNDVRISLRDHAEVS